MEKANVEILSCSFGQKFVTIGYHDRDFDINLTGKKDEFYHPDLQKALEALDTNLADACWINSSYRDNFKASGFSIDEKDSKKLLTISGKMENKHGYMISSVNSGSIPYESERLIKKVEKLIEELYFYFFEGKCAQGTLPGMSRQEMKEAEKEPEAAEA
jgi:hypothetical protein